MKRNWSEILRKCQFPLLITLGTMPVTLYILGAAVAEWVHFGWVLGSVYVLMAILALFVPGKRRILCAAVGCVMLLALGTWAMKTGGHWALVIPSVLYCALLLWSLQMCTWSWDEELPTAWYWIGIVIHVAAYIVYTFSGIDYTISYLHRSTVTFNGENSIFYAARSGTLIAFFGFILLSMLSMNRDCMASAGMGRQKASASMQRKNMLLVLAFFVIALVIAAIPKVAEVLTEVWNWLAGVIGRFLNSIVQRLPIEGSLSDNGGSDMVPGGMGGEPSAFALLMQKIFMVVGTVLAVIVVLGLLYALGRILWKRLVNLMHALSRYVSTVSEDYEDEVTDTRDDGERERARSRRRSRRAAVAEDKNMSPGERIRRRYLRLLYKHPEWSLGATAREKLPADAAPLYEQARYSDHPLTEEDAARFASEIKRL